VLSALTSVLFFRRTEPIKQRRREAPSRPGRRLFHFNHRAG
jgi:hypothetical protein